MLGKASKLLLLMNDSNEGLRNFTETTPFFVAIILRFIRAYDSPVQPIPLNRSCQRFLTLSTSAHWTSE